MGIGLGIVLIVIGAILYCAVNADIPGVSDNTLGIILMVVGALAIVLALIQTQQLQRRRNTTVVDDRREPPAY
jgi:drug/metabolite transporter (DMT)-like permease